MTRMTSARLGPGIAAAVALAADQGTKLLLLYGFGFVDMAPGESVPVLPFFNLVMVWNPGISYGLFPGPRPAGNRVSGRLSRWPRSAVWAGGCGARPAGLWPWVSGLVIGGALGTI